ncbi:MAG: hypothetical protein ACK2TU_06015, partial [Anaerolineales bacterium]
MSLSHEEFYKAANLTMNPFRTNPVSEADPRKGVWVGYNKEQERLLKILQRTRSDQVGNINFALLYGDYGVGKSWTQKRYLFYQIEKYKKNPTDNLLPIFVPHQSLTKSFD